MKNKKKDSKWIWAVIAILIILGIGAYFLLFGNGVAGLPQPPALPA
jgi:flagellar basal body-associated protein FliL